MEAAGNHAELGYLRALETRLLCDTGRARDAERFADGLLELSRGPGETLLKASVIVAAARMKAAVDAQGVAQLLRDCLALPDVENELEFDWLLPEAARLAAAVGDEALSRRVASFAASSHRLSRCTAPHARAIVAEMSGDAETAAGHYRAAASGWARLGVPLECALAYLGVARCEPAAQHEADAGSALAKAVEILTGLGAAPALAEARSLVRRR